MKYIHFTQNFIHNTALAKKIIDHATIEAGDTVLEIGPGKGMLTRILAERVTPSGRVVAVEYDKILMEQLTADFKALPQVKIEYGDILQFDLHGLPANYTVFSNIPFNITSAILEFLFTTNHPPDRAYLILQTDALINDGLPTETFKSLMIKPAYAIQPVYTFSRNDFKPRPHADTMLFRFVRRAQPLIDVAHYELYKDFLAFIARDRVGEGVWRKIFPKRQMMQIVGQTGLVDGRGLKSQSVDAIASLFTHFMNHANQAVVQGAMARLRDEQQKMERINQSGDHRRPKR